MGIPALEDGLFVNLLIFDDLCVYVYIYIHPWGLPLSLSSSPSTLQVAPRVFFMRPSLLVIALHEGLPSRSVCYEVMRVLSFLLYPYDNYLPQNMSESDCCLKSDIAVCSNGRVNLACVGSCFASAGNPEWPGDGNRENLDRRRRLFISNTIWCW